MLNSDWSEVIMVTPDGVNPNQTNHLNRKPYFLMDYHGTLHIKGSGIKSTDSFTFQS